MTDSKSSNIISDSHGNILAIIIRADSKFEGISFLTPDNFGLQIGTMLRPKNDLVPAHIHPQQTRVVKGTQEVLILRSGKMFIELFDEDKNLVESLTITSGDIILLAYGGHQITMIEEVDLVEVKQGPYIKDLDKNYI
jgi:hypothetical protein